MIFCRHGAEMLRCQAVRCSDAVVPRCSDALGILSHRSYDDLEYLAGYAALAEVAHATGMKPGHAAKFVDRFQEAACIVATQLS